MTTQIPDTCRYDGRLWAIDRWDGDTDCIPDNETLDIQTNNPSTANWSGRVNHFIVHEEKLYLLKVEVNLTEESQSEIPANNRREVVIRYEPMTEYTYNGETQVIREYRFEYLYFNNLLIPFTGELHISYPCIDDWELPYMTEDYDDSETEEIVLRFKDGQLAE